MSKNDPRLSDLRLNMTLYVKNNQNSGTVEILSNENNGVHVGLNIDGEVITYHINELSLRPTKKLKEYYIKIRPKNHKEQEKLDNGKSCHVVILDEDGICGDALVLSVPNCLYEE
jgi:hypothetical protein